MIHIMNFIKLAILHVAACAGNPSTAPSTASSTAADSIYEIASTSDGFGTLAAAVEAAGLAEALSGEGTFTVFAPVDSAFEALPEDLLAKLLDPVWQPQLQDVILYHALGNEVNSSMLSDGLTATTLNGEDIVINLDPARINDNSIILIDDGLVDVDASNGIIHGIDAVLVPTSVESNIVDIAAGNEDFSTLVAAVTAGGLVEALSGEGPLTVFAPTNEAFAKLPAETLESLLLPENKDLLVNILQYHVVSANAHSSSLESGDVPTLNGDSVSIVVSDDGVEVNDAMVVKADVIASNGIIHVIDTVLLPPDDSPADEDDAVEATSESPVSVPTVMPSTKVTEPVDSGAFTYGTTLSAFVVFSAVAIFV